MILPRILIAATLACLVSANSELNKKDLKSLRSSWIKVKTNQLQIAETIFLRIIDGLPETSSVKILIDPMMQILVSRPEFRKNVHKLVTEIDETIFNHLEDAIHKFKGFGDLDSNKYNTELDLAQASTLKVFADFMEKDELTAWKKLFKILNH